MISTMLDITQVKRENQCLRVSFMMFLLDIVSIYFLEGERFYSHLC